MPFRVPTCIVLMSVWLMACAADTAVRKPVRESPGPRPAAATPPSEPEPLARAVPIENWHGDVAAPFFRALQRAERGEGQARIAFYGASHVASDLFTGYLRHELQKRFGQAGPGFLLPAKPWRFYRHSLVEFDRTRAWRTLRIRTGHMDVDRYGLAGVALESSDERISIGSFHTDAVGDVKGHASRFELFYAERPGGGRLDVFIDGERVDRVRTAAAQWQPGYATYEVDDGPHQFEVRAFPQDGPVRIYGVAAERDVPGVVLDTLGINGARARYHLLWEESLYRAHLARRRPDLVALAYGTNESGDVNVPIRTYEARLRKVVRRVQETVPDAACLLVGPSDRPRKVDDGIYEDRQRTASLIRTQRRVARDLGCGFFDLVAFMGGPMSMLDWASAEPPLGAPDHIHFTYDGYVRLGEVLLDSLLEGYQPVGDAEPTMTLSAASDSRRSL